MKGALEEHYRQQAANCKRAHRETLRHLKDELQANREATSLLRRVEALTKSDVEAAFNPQLAELSMEATSWLVAHGHVGGGEQK